MAESKQRYVQFGSALGATAVAALLAASCGGSVGAAKIEATGSPGSPTASVVLVGDNHDDGSVPIGTLITGEGPQGYYFVQGLSSEGFDAFHAGAEVDGPDEARRNPTPGILQLAVRRPEGSRLIAARLGADPATAVEAAFAAPGQMPPGWRFVPSSSAAVSAAQFTPGVDPDGTLSRGSVLVDVAIGEADPTKALWVEASAESLTGLLKDLELAGDGWYTGQISPDVHVAIIDAPAHESSVVVIDPPSSLDAPTARSEVATVVAKAVS